jgi:hypothetical protein
MASEESHGIVLKGDNGKAAKGWCWHCDSDENPKPRKVFTARAYRLPPTSLELA